MKKMKRREFVKYTSYGVAVTAMTVSGLPQILFQGSKALGQVHPHVVRRPVNLRMEEAMMEMVDSLHIYHWAFNFMDENTPAEPTRGLRIPGPVLQAFEGDTITISVTNGFPGNHGAQHGFAIPGIVDSGPIPAGQTATLTFTAPRAGTYMYIDPINQPVGWAMGLHGCLMVLPTSGNTPYSNAPEAIQALFDDLGSPGWTPGRGSTHFPGHPWDPDRTWVWFFESADSVLHPQVRANPGLPGAAFKDNYLADYFMINGVSGHFASHAHETAIHGNVGQPALIRCLSTSMANHSPHIHGNHVYMLADNSINGRTDVSAVPFTEDDGLPQNFQVRDNLALLDTWRMAPGDRKDVLLPYIMPPDIPRGRPIDFANAALTAAERQARLGPGVVGDPLNQFGPSPHLTAWPPVEEPFPIVFPMHCHCEMSQTIAGGNYPQGLVTHWAFEGPIDGIITSDVFGANRSQVVDVVPGLNAVITIHRADIRVKLAKVELVGAFSGVRGSVLEVFSGPDFTGSKIGETIVGPDGAWYFEKRSLESLSSRMVSVRALPDPSFTLQARDIFHAHRHMVPLRMI